MNIIPDRYSSSTYDVCVVGGGPVGIATALGLARGDARVLLVESGGIDTDRRAQSLSSVFVKDPKHHRSASLTVHRGLGGTSKWWGGRCVEFDDIDFDHRSHLTESGWPIRHDDLKPFYLAAHRFLKSDRGRDTSAEILSDHPINVESWARTQNVAKANSRELKSTPGLTIAVHSTAIGFDIDAETGRVRSLTVRSKGRNQTVKAQYYVLACGGRENARLLLEMQTGLPTLFNGSDTTVGRFYMGHLTGAIASIQFASRQLSEHFLFKKSSNGTYTRGRFHLNAEMQMANSLLNTVMWPHNFEHLADGALDGASAVYQLLRFGAQHEGADGFERHGFSRSRAAAIILRNPAQAARSCHNLVKNRLLRYPHFFVHNPHNVYWLRYHAEHSPLAQSRVTLAHERDEFGLRRLDVDFRYCQADFQSVVDTHIALDQALRRSSIGTMSFFRKDEELNELVSDQAIDGYHQIGLTRMSNDRKRGAVDINCKVHDLQNLYVAGSSIFPTSGQANPTLPAVALALRLVAHLGEKLRRHIQIAAHL